MISTKKQFTIRRSALAKKFRVENNNLDITALIGATGHTVHRLGDLASAHRYERNKKATSASAFRYVQIGDIDVELGRIKSFRSFTGADAPNNARRLMSYGDVLVSTRRPTRGAIVAVPAEFEGHICTVFFTTLRVANWKVLEPRYLALFLRTSLARFQFQSMITETAYPVISDDDVESMTVLLPPLDEQHRLVEAYDTAISAYFSSINAAASAMVGARQRVEDAVVGRDAERLAVALVGLVHEVVDEEIEVEEESGGHVE